MALILTWSTEVSSLLPDGGEQVRDLSEKLELDIIESDTYTVVATLTSHAVEQGVDVTDHTEPQKDRITVEAAISERPMRIDQVSGTTIAVVDLPNGGKATAIVPPEGTTRRASAFETLRTLNRAGTLVNVEGLIRPLQNYQIETVTSPRSTETAGLLAVSITFVEHRTAEVEEVEAPAPRVERGRGRRNRGRQSPTVGEGLGVGGPSNRDPEAAQGGTAGAAAGTSDVPAEPAQRSSGLSSVRSWLGV